MTNDNLAPYGVFVLRLALGVMFLAHALLKVFVFGIDGTVGFFASIDLPAGLAYATIAAEAIGGVLLIAGVYSRYVALALIPILIGSITHVHGAAGWVFSNQGGGWEYPAFLIAASVAQALLGDGALALRPRIAQALREARRAQGPAPQGRLATTE